MPGQTSLGAVVASATTNTPGSPMATAQKFSVLNRAGNVNLTLLDQDIQFGFTDASGNFTTAYSGFPNTIQVTVRRDGAANGVLQTFFGGVIGTSSVNLEATARATIYSGNVNSLQVIPNVSAHILPVALDYKVWDQFYATGQSSDGTIHLNASNSLPELHVYPTPGNAPGNFGLLDVGPPQNNVPAFRNWIDDGETPNDISYLVNNGLVPVSFQSPKSWKGGPGLKSTLETDFQSQMWVPNLIPLFQAVSYSPYQAATGTGQGATYAIVGFVGVKLSHASGSGNNMDISLQPTAVVDPTAVILNSLPAGTQSSTMTPSTTTNTTITTFGSAKLTY
jgi:hypothetical protein